MSPRVCCLISPPWLGRQGGHSRGEGVEATGSHLQHPILPVLAGHSEIVQGAPEDAEGHPLQQELGVLCLQPQGPPPQPQGGQLAPVKPARGKDSVSSQSWGRSVCAPHPSRPSSDLPASQQATLLVTEIVQRALSQLGDVPKCNFKSISLAASPLNPQATVPRSSADTAQAQSMKLTR